MEQKDKNTTPLIAGQRYVGLFAISFPLSKGQMRKLSDMSLVREVNLDSAATFSHGASLRWVGVNPRNINPEMMAMNISRRIRSAFSLELSEFLFAVNSGAVEFWSSVLQYRREMALREILIGNRSAKAQDCLCSDRCK